jgi:hypothetical protein
MDLTLEPPFRSLQIIPRSWHSSGKRVHIIDSDQAGPPFSAVCGTDIRESRKHLEESFPLPPHGCTSCLRQYETKLEILHKLHHERIRDAGHAQWESDLCDDGTIVDGAPGPLLPVPALPLGEPIMPPAQEPYRVTEPAPEMEEVTDDQPRSEWLRAQALKRS